MLRAIYGKRSRGFKDSTLGLFVNIDAITGEFPNALKDAIREADWFARLLFLRDELIHLGTGACDLPHGPEKARYMHFGIKEDDKPLILDDVFAWLDGQFQVIDLFLGKVFNLLRGTLSSKPVHQMCGMVEHLYWKSSMSWLPGSVFLDEDVGEDDELSHDRGDSDLGFLAGVERRLSVDQRGVRTPIGVATSWLASLGRVKPSAQVYTLFGALAT